MSETEAVSGPDQQELDKENLIEDGKNKELIQCQRCPCKILNPGFSLPTMNHKAEDADSEEDISDYWQVGDVYAFENLGFSKTVSGLKYLICADCEIGPIGWHDIDTKQSYVALSRVRYLNTN
ncbi:hypothetical protein AAG570_009920 [Ranatra chinensis]|uniref:Guanine nucleotide exchange factor MSS4 n=1 Tax=Ranatra chinensis TaxID=642074 RepID=A0ABD0YR31_9HEMI